ncbi:MAG: hypothetical protein H8E38_01760 [SAR324 cluster bacterium]|nr:hypothetical protein [SAR324 cluster bacterium]MBL7035465.1 hypothetical protein [SAR324 cluster bacterium]
MKTFNNRQKFYSILILSGLIFLGSGCSKFASFTKESTAPSTCADQVIARAFNLHENAKSGLALYFEERTENQLYQAYYAASDSVFESRKVKKCWDRRVSHYYAMQNLQEMNSSIARVIKRNMPDNDRGEMISVYRNQYDWLMPNLR